MKMKLTFLAAAMLLALGAGLSGCMEKNNPEMMDESMSMSEPMEDSAMQDTARKDGDAMMKDESMESDMSGSTK